MHLLIRRDEMVCDDELTATRVHEQIRHNGSLRKTDVNVVALVNKF